MRLHHPPARERRRLTAILTDAYVAEDLAACRAACRLVAAHYGLRPPRVDWVERTEVMRATLGVCYEDGRIVLVHPEHWRRRRRQNTAPQWVSVALHELGHYVLWADAERKADRFAAVWATPAPRRRGTVGSVAA